MDIQEHEAALGDLRGRSYMIMVLEVSISQTYKRQSSACTKGLFQAIAA